MDLSFDPTSVFSAKDLVIVITGGGTGIGLAFTTALVKTGARRVYILGRRLEPLNNAARSLNGDSSAPIVAAVECDVSSHESVSAAVARIEKEVGFVDVLINNAGIGGPNQKAAYEAKSVNELQEVLLRDLDGWSPTFAINSTAVARVSAAFLGLLDAANKRRGWESGQIVQGRARARDMANAAEGVEESDVRTSQIITVTSIAAFNRYVTLGIPYSASKAAAVHIGKILSTLLAPWGIRSNMIAPGVYPSDMTKGTPATAPPNLIPLGRLGRAEDLAGLVLYLVGRGGAYVNGDVQVTDGGRLAVHPATY